MRPVSVDGIGRGAGGLRWDVREIQEGWQLETWHLSLPRASTVACSTSHRIRPLLAPQLTPEEVITAPLRQVGEGGRRLRRAGRGISTANVNSTSVCVWGLSLSLESSFSSDRKVTESSWELFALPLSFSPFPCRLTDHKFTTIGYILIPLSVGTRGWLKINNLSFASCSLIFAGSFFWACFGVVVATVVLHCSGVGGGDVGGIFSFFFPPFHFSILYSLEKNERFPGCSRWYGTGQLFQFHSVNSFWCLFLLFGFHG